MHNQCQDLVCLFLCLCSIFYFFSVWPSILSSANAAAAVFCEKMRFVLLCQFCAAYLQHANRKSQITQPQPQLSEDNGKYPTLKKKKKKKKKTILFAPVFPVLAREKNQLKNEALFVWYDVLHDGASLVREKGNLSK